MYFFLVIRGWIIHAIQQYNVEGIKLLYSLIYCLFKDITWISSLTFFISFSIWTNPTVLICDSTCSALLFCCFFYKTYFEFLSLTNKIRYLIFQIKTSLWPLTARDTYQFELTYKDRKVYIYIYNNLICLFIFKCQKI